MSITNGQLENILEIKSVKINGVVNIYQYMYQYMYQYIYISNHQMDQLV